MCEVLEVSRAGYYRWLNREPSRRARANESLLDYLKEVARQQRGVPGYRKLWREAQAAGFDCSKNGVQRLLQAIGYRSCTAMKPGYRKAKPSMAVLPNLLNREFSVTEPNRVWVSDITQVRCHEGWLYLGIVLDLYSRRIVGWAAGVMNTADLVLKALGGAWRTRRPSGPLLFHSDQGSQYRSESVIAWLAKRELTVSMSRRGNCWDNACAESFFAQLKKEWLNPLGELSRQDTIVELQYYIEEFYNTVRRHGTLEMRAPVHFERLAA